MKYAMRNIRYILISLACFMIGILSGFVFFHPIVHYGTSVIGGPCENSRLSRINKTYLWSYSASVDSDNAEFASQLIDARADRGWKCDALSLNYWETNYDVSYVVFHFRYPKYKIINVDNDYSIAAYGRSGECYFARYEKGLPPDTICVTAIDTRVPTDTIVVQLIKNLR